MLERCEIDLTLNRNAQLKVEKKTLHITKIRRLTSNNNFILAKRTSGASWVRNFGKDIFQGAI